MKFGVREICDVVFKAKADTKIGSKIFKKGQPVLYIDSAKTSTIKEHQLLYMHRAEKEILD